MSAHQAMRAARPSRGRKIVGAGNEGADPEIGALPGASSGCVPGEDPPATRLPVAGAASRVALAAVGLCLALAPAGCRTPAPPPAASAGAAGFTLAPIGKVELQKDGTSVLRIDPAFAPGLQGLDGFSHVVVLYWFDRNDTPEKRSILQVHPRGNPDNPLTGVFACRSPVRPNLIGQSVCRIVSVKDGAVRVEGLDAFDGTPLVDLKPYIPPDEPTRDLRVPAWTRSPGRPGP